MYVTKRTSGFGCILCNNLGRKYSSRTVNKLFPISTSNDEETKETKKRNAKYIQRYNSENKKLFGGLVESVNQKRKREKYEPVNNEPIYSKNEDDKTSEVWWWTNHIKMQAHRSAPQNKLPNSYDKSEKSYSHENANDKVCAGTVISKNSGDLFNDKLPKSVNVSVRQENVNSTIFHKSKVRLPQIIVKNITTFPLANDKKHSSKNYAGSTSILSIPMKKSVDSPKNQYLQFPSVSRILNATLSDSSQAALAKWKEKMILELGEEGFQKYQKALLEHGTMFHGTVQRFLSGIPEQEIHVDPAVEGCWNSLNDTVKYITDVKALESHVVHKELLYHGIIDCVALYKGKPLLIEWKKSDKQKTSIRNTYDAPLQVAAYMGALNFDSNYSTKIQGGLVVVAYTDGSPAHVHHISLSECQKYWHLWLERLQLYWQLFDKQEAVN